MILPAFSRGVTIAHGAEALVEASGTEARESSSVNPLGYAERIDLNGCTHDTRDSGLSSNGFVHFHCTCTWRRWNGGQSVCSKNRPRYYVLYGLSAAKF